MMPSTRKHRPLTLLPVAMVLLVGSSRASAQPATPLPPRGYHVQIRYRIYAARSDRIAQFARMTRYLKSIGFEKDEGPEGEEEDATQTRMTGTILVASREERERLTERFLAEPHVKSILLVPARLRLPEDP